MFNLPQGSMIRRIALGKLLGFAMGLIAFLVMPVFVDDISMRFQLAVLLWYATLGALIAIYGLYGKHPILHLRLPWWFRGPLIGAWLNLLVVLFAYEPIMGIMLAIFGENGLFQSPYWFIVDGVFAGLILDGLLTRWVGEGPGLIDTERNYI